jgi:hypothetical protein
LAAFGARPTEHFGVVLLDTPRDPHDHRRRRRPERDGRGAARGTAGSDCRRGGRRRRLSQPSIRHPCPSPDDVS